MARSLAEKALKGERLEARLSPQQKKRIQRAAMIKGTSISDFVILSAEEAAIHTIRENEVLTLNEASRKAFVKALLRPPKPGKKLRAAVKRHRELLGE